MVSRLGEDTAGLRIRQLLLRRRQDLPVYVIILSIKSPIFDEKIIMFRNPYLSSAAIASAATASASSFAALCV